MFVYRIRIIIDSDIFWYRGKIGRQHSMTRYKVFAKAINDINVVESIVDDLVEKNICNRNDIQILYENDTDVDFNNPWK